MLNIEEYLKKFSKDVNLLNFNKNNIVNIIKKHTNLDIPVEKVEIKDCVINIKLSSAIKNTIFINKKAILDDIASLKINITDIR